MVCEQVLYDRKHVSSIDTFIKNELHYSPFLFYSPDFCDNDAASFLKKIQFRQVLLFNSIAEMLLQYKEQIFFLSLRLYREYIFSTY